MRLPHWILICIALTILLPDRSLGQNTTHERLVSLARDFTYQSAELYPLQATALGIAGHDADLESPSEAYRAAYIDRIRQWQRRLGEISAGFDAATSLVDRDDAKLLGALLQAQLNAFVIYQADRKD